MRGNASRVDQHPLTLDHREFQCRGNVLPRRQNLITRGENSRLLRAVRGRRPCGSREPLSDSLPGTLCKRHRVQSMRRIDARREKSRANGTLCGREATPSV